MVVFEYARIFLAPFLRKIFEEAVEEKNSHKVEMAWDDAALNITVNPLEVTHFVCHIKILSSFN